MTQRTLAKYVSTEERRRFYLVEINADMKTIYLLGVVALILGFVTPVKSLPRNGIIRTNGIITTNGIIGTNGRRGVIGRNGFRGIITTNGIIGTNGLLKGIITTNGKTPSRANGRRAAWRSIGQKLMKAARKMGQMKGVQQ